MRHAPARKGAYLPRLHPNPSPVHARRTLAFPAKLARDPTIAKAEKILSKAVTEREIEEQMLAKLQKPSKPKKGKDGKEHNRGCVERAPYPYHPPLLRNGAKSRLLVLGRCAGTA